MSVAVVGFTLAAGEQRKLYRRAYRAQRIDQSEVCGLLIGNCGGRLKLCFLLNRSKQAGHWQLRISDIRMIRKTIRLRKKRVVGTFHSHPISEAVPGRGDVRGVPLNSLMLIYDVCGRRSRLWRIVKSGRRREAKEVPLAI